jgi:hypothetical protein
MVQLITNFHSKTTSILNHVHLIEKLFSTVISLFFKMYVDLVRISKQERRNEGFEFGLFQLHNK